ncbi:glycosyltransferase family 4 protein [Clostridium sp.]|uniref:glycosyltransferase family 4 protein n=1 Tax=Clostridium sp. TaxID=1506 RepID=UPI003463BC23
MKIGIDGRAAVWYRGTGIGTYTYELLKTLNDIDDINNYMIFSPKDSNISLNLKNNFENISGDTILKESFWDSVDIPNNLLEKSLDLYHIPQNGIGIDEKMNCPLIITLHDIIPLKLPNTVGEKYLRLFNEKMPKIIEKCQGIITVSQFSKKDISSHFNFPQDKIFVTPLASEARYRPMDKFMCKDIIKKKYGIKDDFILYVGGFSPRKNIIGLIEAFSGVLKSTKRNLKLLILGKKGISYDIYKKRCEELRISNKVIFPGFIINEDMPLFYNSCEVFVYPSFYEGFGLPPLEAMACGTPVVCSNVTSIPEVVSDAALFINPNDITELKDAVLRVLSDKPLREKLILRGIVRNSNLTWKNTGKQTLIAYSKTINTF